MDGDMGAARRVHRRRGKRRHHRRVRSDDGDGHALTDGGRSRRGSSSPSMAWRLVASACPLMAWRLAPDDGADGLQAAATATGTATRSWTRRARRGVASCRGCGRVRPRRCAARRRVHRRCGGDWQQAAGDNGDGNRRGYALTDGDTGAAWRVHRWRGNRRHRRRVRPRRCAAWRLVAAVGASVPMTGTATRSRLAGGRGSARPVHRRRGGLRPMTGANGLQATATGDGVMVRARPRRCASRRLVH